MAATAIPRSVPVAPATTVIVPVEALGIDIRFEGAEVLFKASVPPSS